MHLLLFLSALLSTVFSANFTLFQLPDGFPDGAIITLTFLHKGPTHFGCWFWEWCPEPKEPVLIDFHDRTEVDMEQWETYNIPAHLRLERRHFHYPVKSNSYVNGKWVGQVVQRQQNDQLPPSNGTWRVDVHKIHQNILNVYFQGYWSGLRGFASMNNVKSISITSDYVDHKRVQMYIRMPTSILPPFSVSQFMGLLGNRAPKYTMLFTIDGFSIGRSLEISAMMQTDGDVNRFPTLAFVPEGRKRPFMKIQQRFRKEGEVVENDGGRSFDCTHGRVETVFVSTHEERVDTICANDKPNGDLQHFTLERYNQTTVRMEMFYKLVDGKPSNHFCFYTIHDDLMHYLDDPFNQMGNRSSAKKFGNAAQQEKGRLVFNLKTKLPADTDIYQVEDGTIFYHYNPRDEYMRPILPQRLYVVSNGQRVNASELPKGGLRAVSVSGNFLYFSAAKKVFRAEFMPTHGIVITPVRARRENEQFCAGGLCRRWLGRRGQQDNDNYYVYRISDEPDRDGILVDRARLKTHSTALSAIQRGRSFYVWEYGEGGPLIRRRSEKVVELEGWMLRGTYASESSYPFIYFMQGGQRNARYMYALHVETMQILPRLEIKGIERVDYIVNVDNGKITVHGSIGKEDYMATSLLPIGYFTPKATADETTQQYQSHFLTNFVPLSIIGEGGFGCVFKARNIMDGQDYAVKRIKLRGSLQSLNYAYTEVRTHAALKHEGIVSYNNAWIETPPSGWQRKADAELLQKVDHNTFQFTYNDDARFMYLQMELCKHTLADWLDNTDTRDIAQAKVWFKQIVSAVAYLHRMNKIHRDLKPGNILEDMNGRLKLCDLGLVADRAMRNGQEVDRTRTIIGTRFYMAPEQMNSTNELQARTQYSSKVDIFSLGLILAEMCMDPLNPYGQFTVFENYREGIANTILDHLPEVAELVNSMTNVDAAERPTCEQILEHPCLIGY